VVSRFNRAVTSQLLAGALEALDAHGVAEQDVEVVHVPGAFEVPFAARRLAANGRFDAVVCLGAVIRGETPHFEYLAAEVTRGIGRVVEDHGLPIAFGVLTTETVEQALERAGAGHGNKGYEAVVTAIEMARLAEQLGGRRR
jgi:6,7-dimethyl-8-ribityllumazine synthase